MSADKYFTLIINSACGGYPAVECDGVNIPVSDTLKGGFSGSYTIKKGHAKALFSLKKGEIKVFKDNSVLFTAQCEEGFAVMENNILKINTEKLTMK